MKQYRIWWKTNISVYGVYRVPVKSVEHGVEILNILADYDLSLSKYDFMEDYTNSGGLEVLQDGDWIEWEDETTGISDPEEWLEHKKSLQSPPEECCRGFCR